MAGQKREARLLARCPGHPRLIVHRRSKDVDARHKATGVRFIFCVRIQSQIMRLGDDGLLIHASSIPRTCGFWSFRPPFEILSSVYFRNSILQFAEKNESIQRRSTLGTSLTKAVQPFSMNRTAVGQARA